MKVFILTMICFISSSLTANAAGFISELIEQSCGGCGVGKAVDEANKELKQANPDYGVTENGVIYRTSLCYSQPKPPWCGQMPLPYSCSNPLFDRFGNQVGCSD